MGIGVSPAGKVIAQRGKAFAHRRGGIRSGGQNTAHAGTGSRISAAVIAQDVRHLPHECLGWHCVRSFSTALKGRDLGSLKPSYTRDFRHPFARASASVQNQASPFPGVIFVSSYQRWPGRW
jgi:hypothetical protein